MDQDDIDRLFLERGMGLVEALGMFALKTLLTLNSGATVVLLALLGNLQGKSSTIRVDISAIQSAMVCFLIGIIFVMVAIAVTYIVAQLEVATAFKTGGVPVWLHLLLMIGPSLASFIAFAWGFLTATLAFSGIG